tara:strand:- start:8487 stop:9425 length:939 start_codon:yes stop_codon:yes gene_type:complete
MSNSSVPLRAWLILGTALLAVSSAGAVFEMMEGPGPLLKAGWRLQATAVVLLPGFVLQWRSSGQEIRQRCMSKNSSLIILASGVCLTLHFGSWLWSLEETTLTHSLLFVTAHPLVIIVGLWILGRPASSKEIIGALLGFTGAALAIMGAGSEEGVSVLGDMLAFLGAVAIVGYLAAGRTLREWMPLFLYAFPVTLIAAIGLSISAMIIEGAPLGMVSTGLLGWSMLIWLPYVAYLALGPGLFGHTGINAVLRWLPPLVVSVTLVMEPLIGSLIGWILGLDSIPGMWTWLGGPLMIAGTLLVTLELAKGDEEE